MTRSRVAGGLLFEPLCTLSRRARWVLGLLAGFCVVLSAAVTRGVMDRHFKLPDASMYVSMAKGDSRLVPQPFVWRPLAPLLVHGIHAVFGCSVERGFELLSGPCLLLTLGVVLHLAFRTEAPRWLLLPLVAVPFWPELWNVLAMPDPLYAALVAGLLLLLGWPQGRWAAALMMFPLMLARESTNLLLLCLLLTGWRWLRWGGSLLAVAAAGAGTAVVRHLAAGSPPNQENLGGGLYLIGKLVCNLLRTLGVLPWSNVYTDLCPAPDGPMWQHAFHLGPVHSIGVCRFRFISPMEAEVALLCTFGLLPWVALALWRRQARGQRGSVLQRFCLLYGGVSFALTPVLGTWYSRLAGYAWPLFLVGIPLLFRTQHEGDRMPERNHALVLLLVVQGALLMKLFVLRGPWDVPVDALLATMGAALLLSGAGKALLGSVPAGPKDAAC